jgi:hypothetical protein
VGGRAKCEAGCLFERVAMAECAGTGGAGLELGGGARVYQAVGLQRLQAGQRQATPLAHVVPSQRDYSVFFSRSFIQTKDFVFSTLGFLFRFCLVFCCLPHPIHTSQSFLSRVADPEPNWIRIQSSQWIRILNPDPDPDPGGQK